MARHSIESHSTLLSPKPMVPSPNTTIAPSIRLPTFFDSGAKEKITATITAPTAGEAASSDKPISPSPRMSLANTGIIAVAPARNITNRSSVIAPSTSLLDQTYARPSATWRSGPLLRSIALRGTGPIRNTATVATAYRAVQRK